MRSENPKQALEFLSTPSARRATLPFSSRQTCFIQFLSTPSARRATVAQKLTERMEKEFLSTPSARRATVCHWSPEQRKCISIHALREEGDSR